MKQRQRIFIVGVIIGFLSPTDVFFLPKATYSQEKIQESVVWHTPEELVKIGFTRSRVVMMNEAHSGLKRCIRTRRIGERILLTADSLGVRHLAMEALFPPAIAKESNRTGSLPEITSGYLSQPEMRSFIQKALDLGWTLVAYEADLQRQHSELSRNDRRNWREEQQAVNLFEALQTLQDSTKLLVWCGNGHHTQVVVQDWVPMGYQFKEISGIDPFVIDQNVTVEFPNRPQTQRELIEEFKDDLTAHGGTAGFLSQEAPYPLRGAERADAFILSIHNALE